MHGRDTRCTCLDACTYTLRGMHTTYWVFRPSWFPQVCLLQGYEYTWGVSMFGRDTRCTCLDACTYTLVACLPPFGYSDPLKSVLVLLLPLFSRSSRARPVCTIGSLHAWAGYKVYLLGRLHIHLAGHAYYLLGIQTQLISSGLPFTGVWIYMRGKHVWSWYSVYLLGRLHIHLGSMLTTFWIFRPVEIRSGSSKFEYPFRIHC